MYSSFSDLCDAFFCQRKTKEEMDLAIKTEWQKHPEWVSQLIAYSADPTVDGSNMRAAWFLTTGFDFFPESYASHEELIVRTMLNVADSSTRRSLARIVALHGHSAEYDEVILDWGFARIMDSGEAIAVKAHCIGIMEHIVVRIPELANEFVEVLEAQLEGASTGVRTRIRATKKRLEKYRLI